MLMLDVKKSPFYVLQHLILNKMIVLKKIQELRCKTQSCEKDYVTLWV